MTMMVTSASFEEVVNALKDAVEEMKLKTEAVDPSKGVVELRRGVNLWTLRDQIKVNLLTIHDVQVVHIESGAWPEGNVQLVGGGSQRQNERKLIGLLRDHLGAERCDLIP